MVKKQLSKHVNPINKTESIYVDISSITPNDYNPNRQSDHDFELLCRSIEEDGFTQPILVQAFDADFKPGMIVDGEHRWRACKVLGWDKIPVQFAYYTQEQMMVSTLRHNRARGSEDINMAADVLKEIDAMGALDHAADSLMMDPIELDIMMKSIPNAELILRNPGEKLSVDQVEDLLTQEKAYQKEKKDEEVSMGKKDNQVWTLQLLVGRFEGRIINAAIGHAQMAKPQAMVKILKEYAAK